MKLATEKLGYLAGFTCYVVFLLWLTSIDYYLFHLIVEVSTFMVSFTLVVFVVLSVRTKKLEFIKPIALGSFLSGMIMIIHMLLYEDFGILSQYGTSESLQFWILGNLVLAISFLFAVISKVKVCKYKLFSTGLLLFVIIISILIFNRVIPEFYNSISGLTNLKIIMEVIIILTYLASIIVAYLTKEKFNKHFFFDLVGVIILLIVAEILFTQYTIVSEGVNSTAHIVKLTGLFILMIGAVKEFIILPINEHLVDLSSEIDNLRNRFLQEEKNSDIFKSLYAESPLGYQSLNRQGVFLNVNDTYANMLGYSRTEMLGRRFMEFMTPESTTNMVETFESFVKNGSVDTIFDMVHRDGHTIPVRFLGKIAYKKSGEFKQTHCILMDISNELEYQKGIIESKAKLEDIIDVTSEGIFTIDGNGICISINEKAMRLLKYRSKGEILGKNMHDLLHKHDQNLNLNEMEECSFSTAINNVNSESKNVNEVFHTKEGGQIDVIANFYPFTTGENIRGVNISFRDHQVSRNVVDSLVNLSYHDMLTGIFNRRYYEEEIKNLDKEANYPLSIIVADINGLKLINDAFGHSAGDKLILSAVEVLTKLGSKNDFIARLGGDEFIIAMPKTELSKAEQRVKDMIAESKKYSTESVGLSISFGVSVKKNASEDYKEIYKNAEDRMYRMKLLDVPSMRSNTIDTIIKTLYEKDKYSEEHSRNVSVLSEAIASKCDLSFQQVNDVRTAGLLHDIGKIVISTDILNKKGKLTKEEYKEIKTHSEIGYRILSSTKELRHLADIVLSHHEWWNGKGYPRNLKEDQIPYMSRIICIADAFDAMTSERLYRSKISERDALEEIKRCSGTQFDPNLVEIFEKNFESILDLKRE